MDCYRDTHYGSTEEDTSATPNSIRHIWGKWIAGQGADVLKEGSEQEIRGICVNTDLDGIEKTKLSAFWCVEVGIPLALRLEGVHHTPVVTVG